MITPKPGARWKAAIFFCRLSELRESALVSPLIMSAE
jgi:hypothetical protein